jgi:anhydro-N-acetylmuramic acid kinase
MMGKPAKFSESGPLAAIGLMSGTSLDGIDAAWLETDGERVTSFGPSLTLPYDAAFRARLHRFVSGVPEKHHPQAVAIEAKLTDLHAEAIEALIAKAGRGPDLIGFHGQTVWHRPERRQTWQIGDGARLFKALNIPIVHDFRAADVANGGQGAPLLPLFHAILVESGKKPVVVANIGGVANITWLGEKRANVSAAQFPYAILGFDTGPGNAMLDDWMLKHTGAIMDKDGKAARAGKVDAQKLARLLSAPFFNQRPPKSLDRLAFDASLVEGLSVNDGAATLVEFTAAAIAKAISQCPAPPAHVLVTGGGRHNPAMMSRLAALTGVQTDPIEAVGCDGDVIEAQAFAYFAVRKVRGLPLTYPELTGAPKPLMGGKLIVD